MWGPWKPCGQNKDLANLVRQKKGKKARKEYFPENEDSWALAELTFTTQAVYPQPMIHAWLCKGKYGMKCP